MKVRVWSKHSSEQKTRVEAVPGLGRVLLGYRASGTVGVGGPGLTVSVDTARIDGKTYSSVYATSP